MHLFIKSSIIGIRELLFLQKIRFKDSNCNKYTEWKNAELREVCEVTMGQSPESIAYNIDSIGLPLIQGNADLVNRTTMPRNYTSSITKKCEIGDLILTVRAPVGSVAKSAHYACIGRGVCSLRVNSANDKEFVYQFLLNYEPKWTALEQGSTFTAVSGNEIKKLEINLPCFEEQKIIASFLSTIDSKLQIEQNILKHYHLQKGHLLKNLFK